MECISPIYIKQKNFKGHVPCGACAFCLENNRSAWSFRLHQEQQNSITSHFLTLTYEDKNCPLIVEDDTGEITGYTLQKDHLQLFHKRLKERQRKYLKKERVKDWPQIRYYSIGEYGGQFERPHYHSIIFNITRGILSELHEIWEKGFIKVGTVTESSIHYVTGYVHKKKEHPPGSQKPYATMTKHPALGDIYLQQNSDWHKDSYERNHVIYNGYKMPIPRYYKDKIYSRTTRNLIANRAIRKGDASHIKELESFKKLTNKSPSSYYAERREAQRKKLELNQKK